MYSGDTEMKESGREWLLGKRRHLRSIFKEEMLDLGKFSRQTRKRASHSKQS